MDQPGKLANNPDRCQLNRKKMMFPYPRSRLKLRSRATDSAVPSRVSLLILHTRRMNLVLTRGIPPDFRGGVHLFSPLTAIGSVPSLSGHIFNCVLMVFTAERPLAQSQWPSR